MSLFRSFLCVSAFTLVAADALANPYANQVLRTRAVPGPHVQITYATVGGSMDGMLSDLIGTVSTYGVEQTPWQYGGSYRANTGSGVVGLYSIQRCDCYVPKGPLTYRLTAKGHYVVPNPPNMELTSTVTVSDSFDAAPLPVGGQGSDGGRWLEPEPIEIQGLDCTVACATDEPDASADVPMTTISDAYAGSDKQSDAPMTNAFEVAPDLRTSSPDLMTASPDVLTASPDVLAASPDVLAASPDLMTASPDVLAASPDVVRASPDVALPDAPGAWDAPAVSVDAASPVVVADAHTSAPAPANTKSQGSKGCSISLQAPSSGLPLVALLALLGLRRRRRG